jgi:hypothetical protein
VTVDEMDLVRQLKDDAPLRAEAYERAWTTLRAAMAETGPAPVPEMTTAAGPAPVRRRRFSLAGGRHRIGTVGKVGIGTGIGVAAAAVAVSLVATSSTPRSALPGSTTPAGSAAQAPAAGSPLVSLAALIRSNGGSLPGNASLVIRTQAETGVPVQVSYNLYADNGAFYGGGDKTSLREAVNRHENMADGIDAREVAAARYAASGNLTAARERMINATPNSWGLGLSPAQQQAIWNKSIAKLRAKFAANGIKTLPKRPTGKALQYDLDNYVWNNSVDALSAGAGNPQVRAGVLRLLSTIPEVTVAHSRTAGQPTLTLTAGPALFGGGTDEVLTINATTGMPVKSVMQGHGDVPSSVDTYRVIRVTLAAIKAGKF